MIDSSFRQPFTRQQIRNLLLAPLLAGAIAWILFVVVGATPPIRASALAFVIVLMAFALRWTGMIFSMIGALALAICPAYWTQTGGTEAYSLMAIGAMLIGGLIVGGLIYRITHSWGWTFCGVMLVLAGSALIAQSIGVGSERSLRLTTILTALLLAVLSDALHASNPRPDSAPSNGVRSQHIALLIGAFALGVINDPMMTLFAPALLLGLTLMRVKFSPVVWLTILAITIFGVWRVITVYVDIPFYWNMPASQAITNNLQVPTLIAGAWREPQRWINLIEFIVGQFTPIGAVLGVLGLARLARWYPPLGVVTLVAFSTYSIFGLLYFGGDAAVLLLPLLMIEVIWIASALLALYQWILKMTGAKPDWRGAQNPI